MPLLEATGIGVEIQGTRIVEHAALTVDRGAVVALVGPNGAGKSTVARTLAGLQAPSAGSVLWNGAPASGLSGRRLAQLRAFVPQHGPTPGGMTVHEAVTIGRAPHIGALRRPTRHDHEVVDAAIERVGATALAGRMLATLSGGELQRVRVGVALAQEAPCLMLDEPTSSLDLGAAARLGQLLRGLADGGFGVLVVLQDLALAAAIADTVVVMHGGRTVASGRPAEVLTPQRLAEIWQVDAELTVDPSGRGTALHIDWLGVPGRHRSPDVLQEAHR